ncbi:MAG: histidinol-phosphatase [Ignavibacteriales bacterium CG07_land_8_20_14_0_80_59_12]|nr:MAG: histidinol-phosphatase [Ignavibacteriales bacterium CG07_land_8_20_14_0_80_59_12]
MNKKDVAHLLEEIGTLLELKNENPFKVRAYHNAARIINGLIENLEELVANGQLRSIKGIGEGLAEKITEFVRTGRLPYYEELKKSLPPGLEEMLAIPGLGPKRIKALYDTLDISMIGELEYACHENRLLDLEGFGIKMQENILKGIEQVRRHSEKHLFPTALEAAESLLSEISRLKGVIRSGIGGSLRRRKEVIGDIDILVSARPAEAPAIIEAFASHPDVEHVTAKGETKSSVHLKSGINADLRVINDKEYPFALHYFTGSKEHNIAMRSLAKKRGIKMNEYGLFREPSDKLIPCADEEGIFRLLGMSYIPPELREDMGEIDAAIAGRLPELVENNDLRGTFHCHTKYSDGVNTVGQMAAAARVLSWEYLGIADHSQSAAYANGLDAARVKTQWKEIDAFNGTSKGFRVFKGTETDILPDGTLDFPDKVLSGFDYVVISVHSKFKISEADMTKRIIKALKNKYATMVGHLTGRLLLSREPYPVDVQAVIDAAADYGKMIEINAHPLRLDLDWRWCRYAKEKGILLPINPDAHNTDGLRDTWYGVGTARKGWLEKKDVLNTFTAAQVEKRFESIHQ